MDGQMIEVLIPFHAGDQFSAAALLENLMAASIGQDLSDIRVTLQFDLDSGALRIQDTIDKLETIFNVQVLLQLP